MNNLELLIRGTRLCIRDLKAMETMILHFAAAGIPVPEHTKAGVLDAVSGMLSMAFAMKTNPNAPPELIKDIANSCDRILLLVK